MSAAFGYVALLFAVAAWGDRHGQLKRGLRPWVYALSLAVYCTSWTFFGAVGTAATAGWEYLAIYIGPFLVYVAGHSLVRKIVTIGKRHETTSIADFIAARYGKSQLLAALVTVIAVVGALPYVALQLKSVAMSYTALSRPDEVLAGGPPQAGLVLVVAMTLAVFAILFGTRHIDATAHNRGMILAIALESGVKLVALMAVGLFAYFLLPGGGWERLSTAAAARATGGVFSVADFGPRFFTLTVLSMGAILCLPRQFHVAVVECQDPAYVKPARVIFPAYLALVSLAVVPITFAGLSLLAGAATPPDLFVLALPLRQGNEPLALFAFIGGLSAATAMVIVATVALSTMLTNDLIVPLLLRRGLLQRYRAEDVGRVLLVTRRAVIVGFLLLCYLYLRGVHGANTLAGLGTLSFAAVVQFTPALVGAVTWRRGHRHGVAAGLIAGFSLWFALLMLPAYTGTAWETVAGVDFLTFGVMTSLGANSALYIGVSLFARPRVVDRVQAASFVGGQETARRRMGTVEGRVRVEDLMALLERFLGRDKTAEAFHAYSLVVDRKLAPLDPVDSGLIRFTERQLSRVLGASSARIILTSALKGSEIPIEDVVSLLDETSQRLRFSQDLLQATLEHIGQGVSVVDGELNIIAWNSQYLRLLGYPPGTIWVGRPIEEIVRFNAARGEYGAGDLEDKINGRLATMRKGVPHAIERTRPNGTVLKIEGRPMAGGGYVTSYSDITETKRYEEALREGERRIRFYTDSFPALISFVDAKEHLRFANRAFMKLFGKAGRPVLDRPLSEILSPADYALRREHIAAALAGERRIFDIAWPNEEDGGTTHIQVTYVPHFDPQGAVDGFFVMYLDITARRQAELALKEALESLEQRVAERTRELSQVNAALRQENDRREQLARELAAAKQVAEGATASKTRFLAAASHDVLQPLNAARLFTSALEEECSRHNPQSLELVRNIERALESSDRLLKALLNISKLDAGGLQPSFSVFSVHDLICDLATEFKVLAEAKGLALRAVPSHAVTRSDRGLLLSVLQNLLSNAVRYTAAGKVLIGCRRRGQTLRIAVYDTGPGIPLDKQREIFEEFRRLANGGDPAERGLGLGLAIVDRVVKLLGHDITLVSQPGRGSLFAVTVPLLAASAEAARHPAPRAGGSLAGTRVLCVDNEPQVLAGLRALLERWGCQVTTARSIREGRAAFAGDGAAPDLLVLDYRLDDGVTGFAFADAMLKLWGRLPPTVMLTADGFQQTRREAEKRRIPVLAKPVEPAALRALLTQLARRAAE
ncbi:MAG: NahK/ErcS family hybrid sensor histidine kinase/response regulator [Pseudomonadota bacterium]